MTAKSISPALIKDVSDETDGDGLQEYIARIGDRIRASRTSRGMIRKDLSRQSGVSERYIAQVETGKANISIVMLWKIAQSMAIPIPELLPDSEQRSDSAALQTFFARLDQQQQDDALQLLKKHFSKSDQQIRGVALVGLRGAGKSSLGRILADEYAVSFVQLSELIEAQAKMSTAELFSLGGQKSYRRLEMQALRQALSIKGKIVIETGGSLVTEPETYKLLLDNYYTVWVKAQPDEHMNRVLAQGDLRPMANNDEAMEDLKLILEERRTLYSQSDFILDTAGSSLLECADMLATQCQLYLAE